MRDSRELEKVVKGFANHWRIDILRLLVNDPGATLFEIAEKLKMNEKTASEHVRRLALVELVTKRYEGSMVHHTLTPRAHRILKFLRILE